MNILLIGLSKKYAKAFFNDFSSELNFDEIINIDKLVVYLKQNKKILAYADVPVLARESKLKIFSELFKNFKLNNAFNNLVDILNQKKRLRLLPDILKEISVLYKNCFNIMDFNIISSHQLTKDELTKIVNFLKQRTGKEIIYHIKVDPCLIAGIKIYSNTLGLEQSVRQQLIALSKIN